MDEEALTCSLISEKLPSLAEAVWQLEEALKADDPEAIVNGLARIEDVAGSAVEGFMLLAIEETPVGDAN
jgi:hypothetical protein